jgi:FixJ family two-component response regulator
MARKAIPVCVIDDDASVRRAFLLLLQSAGYNARAFGSAEEYLEKKNNDEESILILDMRMPGMTGLDLLKELSNRKDKPKIIALSAYDDASTRELSVTLGVVAFFRKPVDDQALIDTIEWAMREKKQ